MFGLHEPDKTAGDRTKRLCHDSPFYSKSRKGQIGLSLTLLALVRGFSPEGIGKQSLRRRCVHPFAERVSEDFGATADDTKSQRQRIRFMSPLLEYGYPPTVSEFQNGTLNEKPLLLYLPGFDGTYLSPFLQFPELDTIFDVRCMTVDVEDRSSLDDLKVAVLEFIRSETVENGEAAIDSEILLANKTTTKLSNKRKREKRSSSPPNKKSRPFYLAGESFGGILACEVALDLRQDKSLAFRGLALINPATCYYRSRLAMEGPIVAASNPYFYYFNLLRLLPLFTDDYSFDQLLMILRGEALPSVIDNEMREAYLGRVAFSLPFVVPVMKQGTLQWRLSEWLEKGSARMEGKLEQLAAENSLRILLVVGENDGTLPSIDEAERLAGILGPKQLTIHVVEGAGHASTCGSRVDLAALFRQTFPRLRRIHRNAARKATKSGPRWPPWRKVEPAEQEVYTKPRTAMKPIAAQGKGKYLGMEPRYDNATVGLSPLKYWNSAYYKKISP